MPFCKVILAGNCHFFTIPYHADFSLANFELSLASVLHIYPAIGQYQMLYIKGSLGLFCSILASYFPIVNFKY